MKPDIKKTFMLSLRSLLEKTTNTQEAELVHRLFSNIKSPENFPNLGKDSESVTILA